jgi:hypothetical protein
MTTRNVYFDYFERRRQLATDKVQSLRDAIACNKSGDKLATAIYISAARSTQRQIALLDAAYAASRLERGLSQSTHVVDDMRVVDACEARMHQ